MSRFAEKIRLGSLGLHIAGNDRWMASLQRGLRHDTFIYIFRIYFNNKANVYDLKLVIGPCLVVFLYTGKLLAGGGGRFWIERFSLTELRQKNVNVWRKKTWIGNAPPDSNQRDEGSSHLCTSNTFSISLQCTLYIECSFRTFTSNPSWQVQESIVLLLLLTLYPFISYRKCKSRIHTSKHFQEITLFSNIWTESANVYYRKYKITLKGMSEVTKTTKKSEWGTKIINLRIIRI